MKTNQIPVVFSADANYAYPMIFSVLSMIRHAKEDTDYEFILLVSHDFPKKYKDIMDKHIQVANMTVRYIDMQDEFQGIDMHIKHITQATYYRLKLPGLLQDIDKCIYLDVDIIVQKDLSGLFAVDMQDYYIAGVKAAGYYYPPEKVERNLGNLQIPAFDQYVNAGVLVMNLEAMRHDHMEERFEELLDRDFPSQDQDILNCACYGKIKLLPLVYNVMNKYKVSHVENYDIDPCLPLCYTREEWEEAGKEPVIIHFADRWKPWDDMSGDMSEKWWEEVMATGEFESFFADFYLIMQKRQRKIVEDQNEKNEAFREKVLSQKRNIEAKLKKVREEKIALRAEKNERIESLREKVAQKNQRIETLKENNAKKTKNNAQLRAENAKLRNELHAIYSSKTYKLCRGLTWLPRKIKGIFQK